MAIKVVYFSRDGRSKRLAETAAKGLNAPLVELSDTQNWKGIVGYLRAGRYTMSDKEYPITVKGNLQPEDTLVVFSPLWAGGVAQTVRLFLKNQDTTHVHLAITSKGSTAGKLDRKKFASVTDIVERLKQDDQMVAVLISELKTKA